MISEHQLGKIWAQESSTFARVYPWTADVTFALVEHHHLPASQCTARDLGWYVPDERRVYLIRAALRRSPGHVRGLLRHELGHAADKRIAESGAERRADALARRATGAPIRYTREGLQHATHGKAHRPDWLHQ